MSKTNRGEPGNDPAELIFCLSGLAYCLWCGLLG